MDPLFIDDGFTRTGSVPPAPGIHPGAAVVFRPALSKERTAYAAVLQSNDPDRVDRFECDLIAKYVKELNDQPLNQWRDKLPRLHPSVKTQLVNLVLGYTAARTVEEEIVSFPSASG